MDLDSYGGTDPLDKFPLFLKTTADVLALRLAMVFLQLLVWVALLFAGERLMSPQFQRGYLPPQWTIAD